MKRVPATVPGKSLTRRYRSVGASVSLWLVLCQFPLPVVHAHAADARDEPTLATHLDRHHRADTYHTEQWHWHLMMPWEMGQEPDEEDSCPSGFALPTIWSPSEEMAAPCGRSSDWHPESAWPRHRHRLETVILAAVGMVSRVDHPPGFLSTYAGVSLVALVGVSLR